jgi:rare lipoprotein A (peptidoglycan hydrolase)
MSNTQTLCGTIYYGHKSFAEAQDDFLTQGTLVGSTVYQRPTDKYKDRIQGSSFIVANGSDPEKNKDVGLSGSVKPFGADVSMHFKSYTRIKDGQLQAFLPTGNAGYALEEESVFSINSLVRSAKIFIANPTLERRSQTNTGVTFTGKAAERILDLQKLLLSGQSVSKVDLEEGVSLSRGDNTSSEIISSLAQATEGDQVQLSSPYLANKRIIDGLVKAKAAGADVSVTMSPGYTGSADRRATAAYLAQRGVKVFTSKGGKLVHQKNFVMSGRTNIAVTGSDNYTGSSSTNKTLDYALILKGKSNLQDLILEDNKEVNSELDPVNTPAESFYASQEFGFLYQTNYGMVQSRTQGNIEAAEDKTGFIKSTKLNSGYFDRHLNGKLPEYSGFTSTYEAITGIRASQAIKNMDKAVGSPSIGHQMNRALGFKLYSDGLGLVGSIVSLGGRLTDYLTGHYAYKRNVEQRKNGKGSMRKFEAILEQDWQQSEAYTGGPIEKGFTAVFGAAKSLVLVGVGYAAVLSGQYAAAAFLEEGAHRAVTPSANKTMLQNLTSRMYLSSKGLEVQAAADELIRTGQAIDPRNARRQAMNTLYSATGAVSPNELLGRGTKLPSLLNRMRTVSATAMDYVLSSILPMVVPTAHLPSATNAAKELVQAIGKPITMDESGLKNLLTERAGNVGKAIEKLVGHIPIELHLWMPALREANDANGVPNPNTDPKAHYPLNNGRISLGEGMGAGAMQKTIAAFIQTTVRFGEALANPAAEIAHLREDYRLSRRVAAADQALVKALDKGTATEAQVRNFFTKQTQLSEQLKRYGNGASVTSRSAENGVMSQGIFKSGIGRTGLLIAGAFVGDFLLDEFVLRNQGADFFTQMALTRSVRNNEGNIIQIQLNGTVPLAVTAVTATAAAITSGYIFPTVHGASKYSSPAMAKLAVSQAADLAQTVIDYEHYGGTRARFNFKAAAVGTVLGLVGLKVGFMAVAGIANAFFPVKGVKLDPETEVVTGKILSVLNRTRSKLFTVDENGETIVKPGTTIGALTARQQLKDTLDRLRVSDIRRNNRSPGSNFYSTALQLTNTGFIQTAIVQRTDALQQRTSYSFGVQLFASAGMGLTPNLPFGIVTQRASKEDQKNLAEQADAAMVQRYGEAIANSRAGGLAQTALDMFGFISYEPNSQITNALLGLGVLSYADAALNKIIKLPEYGPQPAQAQHKEDLMAFGKVARMGLNLTTSFIKYSTALSDFLPRMVGQAVGVAFPELRTNPFAVAGKKILNPLIKNKFALLGYAMGVAMSDPYLGVEALDNTTNSSSEHPFTNPIARLVTAVGFGAYTAYAADAIGLNGRPNPNSALSRIIPNARAYQAQLYEPDTNSLRKSGARTMLAAGVVFTTYLAANILARVIGTVGGEEQLNQTYQRVGLLRLFSGVSAKEYAPGTAHNLLGDVLGSIVERVPYVGQPLAKFTGLYKDDAKLHVPLLGTPFGASYNNKTGESRGYGQTGDITIDISMSVYSKFSAGFSRDQMREFARLEAIDFDQFADPELAMQQVLQGGEARPSKMKVSEVSKYALQNLQAAGGELSRAYQLKQHRRNWVMAQRASELLAKESHQAGLFGFAEVWTGQKFEYFKKGKYDPNLGLGIKQTDYSKQGKAINTGDYASFADTIQDSAYRDRNISTPHLLQTVEDMYAAYTPSSKKREKNMMGAAILSLVGTTATVIMAYNTLLGATEFLGALEVVKFGQSADRLLSNRIEIGNTFKSRNSLNIQLSANATGSPTAQITPRGQRFGVGFTREIELLPHGLNDVNQIKASYAKGLDGLASYFKAGAGELRFQSYSGGVKANAYDLILRGDVDAGITHLQKAFVTELTNNQTGILTQTMGSGTHFTVFGEASQTAGHTPVSFAGEVVAPRGIYDSLEVYAKELNGRKDLTIWQKRELLNAHKVQIEMRAVETHVLGHTTNTIDKLAIEAANGQMTAPLELGRGFSHTLKRAASGAGLLMSGYFVFGKDGYALAEGLTFISSKDSKLKQAAARQIVGTSAFLALGLTLQKGISSVMGTNQYGLVTLGVTLAASLGINYLADQLKASAMGTQIRTAERNTANFFAAGIEAVGTVIGFIPGLNLIPEALGHYLFKPIGRAIQKTYNDQTRISPANAGLAQMFLPESIFKTSDFVAKRVRVGTQSVEVPFVMADNGGADLAGYYRNLNAAALQKTMTLGKDTSLTSSFSQGRSDSKNYAQSTFYQRYFDMSARSASSPLSEFALGANYRMSESLMLAISNRAAASAHGRYGRMLRRPHQPEHGYVGPALSGLGTTNEGTRIATQSQSGFGRPVADALAQVQSRGNQVLQPIKTAGSYVSRLTSAVTSRINYYTSPVVDFLFGPISQVLQGIGNNIGRFFGGAQVVATTMSNTAIISAHLGAHQLNFNVEKQLERLGRLVTNRIGGPVARITLEALHGASTLVASGSSLFLNLIDKLPTVEPTKRVPVPVIPPFGFNSLPVYTDSKVFSALGEGSRHLWKFVRGNLPFYLDVAQILPATLGLQGASEQTLTKMERMRLHEQQGAAVGGTLVALGASALRFNLLTTIAVSVVGALVGGKGGKEGGRKDYDENSSFYKNIQTGLGVVTLGLSGLQSLISYYRRIDIHNNFVEVYINDQHSKRARVVYAQDFETKRAKNEAQIKRLQSQPDSTFKTQRLQQLNQQRLGLQFEYHHEQSHLEQFDVAKQEFVLQPDAVIDQMKADSKHYTPVVDRGLRRLAEISGQDQLYQNPSIDKTTYNQIVELEYQAHVRAFTTTLAEVEGTDYDAHRYSSEAHLQHYANRLERQLSRGRSYNRTPTTLAPDATPATIDRLYNPGGTGSGSRPPKPGAPGFSQIDSGHYHKAAGLMSTGFSSGARLVQAFQTLTAVPAAVIESANQKTKLEDIQATYGTSNYQATKVALIQRGEQNAQYMYATAIGGTLSAMFKSPVALMGIALYSGLGALGGAIPFTTIPLIPTLGQSQLAEAYSNHMRSKMRASEYAYEGWATSTAPINALKNHRFDMADRELVYRVSRKVGSNLGTLVKDTVGYFKAHKKLTTATFIGLGLAALVNYGSFQLELRDTDLGMFTLKNAVVLAAAAGVAKVGAPIAKSVAKYAANFAVYNLAPRMTAYFTAGLDLSEIEWKLKPNGKTTKGSAALLKGQKFLKLIPIALTKLDTLFHMARAYVQDYNRVTEVGKYTGLATKYNNQVSNLLNLTAGQRRFLNVVAWVPRLVTLAHRPIRYINLGFTAIAHSIEDYGITKALGQTQTAATPGRLGQSLAWLNSMRGAAGNVLGELVSKVTLKEQRQFAARALADSRVGRAALTAGLILNVGKAGVGNFSKFVIKKSGLPKLGQALASGGKKLATAGAAFLAPKLPLLGKLGGLGLLGLVTFKTGGNEAVAGSVAAIGLTYGVAKFGNGLMLGRAVGHHLLQDGLLGTSLSAYAIAVDGVGIISTSYNFARLKPNQHTRQNYQQAYINSASHTSGLITTMQLIPKLGVVRGLIASGLLTLGMTGVAKNVADERFVERKQGLGQDTTMLVIQDLLRPAIQQTMMAGELTDLAGRGMQGLAKTKMGQTISSLIVKNQSVRAWKLFRITAERSVAQVIKARALRTFGEGAKALADGAATLKGAASSVGKFFAGAASKILSLINVGLIVYGGHQVMTAKTEAQRTEGYRTMSSSLASAAVTLLVGTASAPAEAVPGPGTAVHVGLTITASVVAGYIGDLFGQGVGYLHNSYLRSGGTNFDPGAMFKGAISGMFGSPANAAMAPGSKQPEVQAFDPNSQASFSLSDSLAGYAGSQWQNFRMGIGNLYKQAKLKWGRFANLINPTTYINSPQRLAKLASGAVGSILSAISSAAGNDSATSSLVNGAQIYSSGGGVGATITSSTYTPGAGGMNAGLVDSRGKRLNASDFVIAIAGQNVLKDQIPYGSKVRLTYKGKSVLAEVRDGGPYFPGRQMDITQGAAKALGFTGVGAVGVTLESLPKGSDPNKKYYFGEATYRPAIYGNGNVSQAEAQKAINSVVNGSNYLILGKPAAVNNPTMQGAAPVTSPTQANLIIKPIAKPATSAPAVKPAATTTTKATVKYSAQKSTAPVPAGKKLRKLPKDLAVNLSLQNGQLRATATEQANGNTYFNQVNTPASTQTLNGRALAV